MLSSWYVCCPDGMRAVHATCLLSRQHICHNVTCRPDDKYAAQAAHVLSRQLVCCLDTICAVQTECQPRQRHRPFKSPTEPLLKPIYAAEHEDLPTHEIQLEPNLPIPSTQLLPTSHLVIEQRRRAGARSAARSTTEHTVAETLPRPLGGTGKVRR